MEGFGKRVGYKEGEKKKKSKMEERRQKEEMWEKYFQM